MPSRTEFYSLPYMLKQIEVNAKIGNHLKVISLIQAYFDHEQNKTKIPLYMLYSMIRSLYALNEHLAAYKILSEFITVEYINYRREIEGVENLKSDLMLIFLDLSLSIGHMYDDESLALLLKEPYQINFRDLFVKFFSIEVQPTNQVYKKIYNRFKFIHGYLLSLIQSDNMQKQQTLLQPLFEAQIVSPVLLYNYIQQKLVLNQNIANDVQLLKLSVKYVKCDFATIQNSFSHLEIESFLQQYQADQNINGFLNSVIEFLISDEQIAFDTKVLESVFGLLKLRFLTKKQLTIHLVILLAETIIQLDRSNIPVKLQYQRVKYQIEQFLQVIQCNQTFIDANEQFQYIYNVFEPEFFKQVEMKRIDYREYSQLYKELISQNVTKSFVSLNQIIRKQIAEFHYQCGLQLLSVEATQLSLEHLHRAIEIFPLDDACKLTQRILARSGREKEAKELQQVWEMLGE